MTPAPGSLAALRKRIFEELGDVTQPMPGRILTKFVGILLLGVGAELLFLMSEGWAERGLAVLLATLSTIGIGTTIHTASHGAVFASDRANRVLTWVGYPLAISLSATMWWHRHCKMHHASPNVVNADADIDFAPLFAIRTEDVEGRSAAWRAWVKVQWLALPFLLAFNGWSQIRQGWAWILRSLLDPKERRREHAIDLAMMSLHWVIWGVVPALFFPWQDVLVFLLLRNVGAGYAMFAVLAPGHLPDVTPLLGSELQRAEWMIRQTLTTVNFSTGWLGRFLCSGLEYQIEHHLMPSIPDPVYRRIAPIVQKFCEEHGYPYRSFSWTNALLRSWLTFKNMRPTHTDLTRAIEEATEAMSPGMLAE